MRSILTAKPAFEETVTITDMEAGIEHLSRGTTRATDIMLIVAEPYYKSLETAARVRKMAEDLGIERTYIVANKVRNDTEASAIEAFCKQQNLEIIGTIPYDEKVAEASMVPTSPVDYQPDSIGVAAVTTLAEKLSTIRPGHQSIAA